MITDESRKLIDFSHRVIEQNVKLLQAVLYETRDRYKAWNMQKRGGEG